jgi:hypothetical protein
MTRSSVVRAPGRIDKQGGSCKVDCVKDASAILYLSSRSARISIAGASPAMSSG